MSQRQERPTRQTWQLPLLEQYCLQTEIILGPSGTCTCTSSLMAIVWCCPVRNAAEARILEQGMQPHFAPCPSRAFFFAQESTAVPSPSFDCLQDDCTRVATVSSRALFKLTLTDTQAQLKAHQPWHRPRNHPLQVSATTFREQIPKSKRLQP